MTSLVTTRRRAARLCLAALAFVAIVLPGLHVVVHAVEDAVAHATAGAGRRAYGGKVRVVASQRVAAGQRDGDGHGHGHGHGHAPRHDHGGDGPHGAGSPEHLQTLALASAPVLLPPRAGRARLEDPVALQDRLVSAPPRGAHGARGPPAEQS